MRIASCEACRGRRRRRDLGEEIYYDAVVHDAQLLYLLARHFPTRLGTTPPAALETISAAVSGGQANSLSAAYTLLALDAFTKTQRRRDARHHRDRQGRPLACADAAGRRDAEGRRLGDRGQAASSRSDGPLRRTYVVNESGFDRNPPATEMNQGIEIFREFVDAKGNR